MKKTLCIVLSILALTACSSSEKKSLKRMIELDKKMIVETTDSIQAREARNEAFNLELKDKETRLKEMEKTIAKQDSVIESLNKHIYSEGGVHYLFNRKR